MPIRQPDADRRRALMVVMRGWPAVVPAAGAALAFCGYLHPLFAADPPRSPAAAPGSGGTTTEWVSFGDSRLPPVRVLRGSGAPVRGASVQIVTFGTGRGDSVKVVRGTGSAASPSGAAIIARSEARPAAAKMLRLLSDDAAALFAPAGVGELDRIAFAVDGIESRHGADLRMWRPELIGPQGPMQITAAAAFDVGGGDRFDMRENRLLGRAYLARMFRRYGNWSDALAAFNWGPANLDLWIAAGRPSEKLPDDVNRYVAMVLRDALASSASW